MKLERMLSMVIYLLKRGRVSAQELSEAFEVSVRTVYRDVESINLAGIPITAQKGPGGGIEIMEGYKLRDGVLTQEEVGSLEGMLRSIASFYNDKSLTSAWEKVSSLGESTKQQNVLFDFTPWSMSKRIKGYYDDLKKSIDESKLVVLTYLGGDGKVSIRVIEPMTLVFKGASWYLHAYCRVREDYRLFKLNRVQGVAPLDATFERREGEWEVGPKRWNTHDNYVNLVLHFESFMQRRVYDEFHPNSIKVLEDGSLLVEVHYPDDAWLYYYLLGFGDGLKVVSPAHVHEKIIEIAKKVISSYNS